MFLKTFYDKFDNKKPWTNESVNKNISIFFKITPLYKKGDSNQIDKNRIKSELKMEKKNIDPE